MIKISRLSAALAILAALAAPAIADTFNFRAPLQQTVVFGSSSSPSLSTSSPDGIDVSITTSSFQGSGSMSVAAPQVSGATDPVTWTVSAGTIPPGMILNASTGAITGEATAPGTWSGIQLRLTDALGHVAETASFSITVNSSTPPPVSTMNVGGFPSLVQARSGQTISNMVPSVNNNVGAVQWSLYQGTLPPGMSLNASTGELEGAPQLYGYYPNVQLKARDSVGNTAYSPVTNFMIAGPLTINGIPDLVGANTVIPVNLVAEAWGVMGNVSWQASGLPPGLTLNSYGQILGTPTAMGSYASSVTLTDSGDGSTATKSFTVTVGTYTTGNFQTYDKNGTFTPPKLPFTVRVLAIGGGAGGCGADETHPQWACGGASGHVAMQTVTITAPGPVAITVGLGGAGASDGNTGSAPIGARGGSSSFGSQVVALGGQGRTDGQSSGAMEGSLVAQRITGLSLGFITRMTVTAGDAGVSTGYWEPGGLNCTVNGDTTKQSLVSLGGAGGLLMDGNEKWTNNTTIGTNGSIKYASASSGYDLGQRGKGYGAGGGGGYGIGCYDRDDAKGGRGHDGYVIVEWDGQ